MTQEERRYELLVGSESFWRRARTDIERAKRRVHVQALTFEGDETGAPRDPDRPGLALSRAR